MSGVATDDPLDGTANYVHGMENYAVSIALRRGRDICLGVVYDPRRDEMYAASRGAGATLNGRPLRVSQVTRLAAAMLAASFSPRVAPDSPEITRFVQVLQRCQTLRRVGSAALNLGYVAAGCMDGYWSTSVKAWDVAAGVLLVREAGGLVTAIDGDEFDLCRPDFIAAANGTLHRQLLEALQLPGADRTVWLT